MKLYHYSTEQLSELLTRRLQGADEKEIDIATFKAKRMGLPFPYHDHISFFLSPLPLELIASTFPHGHPFWIAGKELYEYVIDTKDIAPNSFWRIVESIEQEKFSDQFDWIGTTDLNVRSGWFQQLNNFTAKKGYSGFDIRLLEKAKSKLKPLSMLDYYRRAAVLRESDNTQYAAYVPHVMIYPIGGKIPIKTTRKVMLGNRKADPVLFHLSFRDLPHTLTPRQPEDSGSDTTAFTEQLPNRVSFSPTIKQAFAAIYPNISKFFENESQSSIRMRVYSPVGNATLPTIPADKVTRRVYDAHYTGEICYTAPVKIEYIGEVIIQNDGKDITIHPFNDSSKPKQFIAPDASMEFIPIDNYVIMI